MENNCPNVAVRYQANVLLLCIHGDASVLEGFVECLLPSNRRMQQYVHSHISALKSTLFSVCFT
jgi:hypothetical protein